MAVVGGGQQLLAVGIIEKDQHGDVLMVWSYPIMSSDHREMYLAKCPLSVTGNKETTDFGYGQHQNTWYYMHTVQERSEKLPQGGIDSDLTITCCDFSLVSGVTGVSLILVARDFHPEKYGALTGVLMKAYMSSGSPSTLLEAYLAVFTQGQCASPNNDSKLYNLEDYDPRQALINCSIKDVIIQFGLETILIYTALMLKKRVAVYHSKLRPLLSFTRALPTLVWHRQDWSLLYPWVSLEERELTDLQKRSTYIAGFTDSAIESRSNLYDILVNLTTSEITIAKHAKGTFAMGKLHKDIALFMVKCVDDSDKSQQQMIKEISTKTKELLTNLRGLATEGEDGKLTITLEQLKERKMPVATENFLYSLAAVEGLVSV